jgi:hypothetical protein
LKMYSLVLGLRISAFLFLCTREVGICNPWFYVLLILIKFSTTKRGRRILLVS